MLYTKLALPLMLGVSLISVSAAVVYYVFFKDEDELNAKVVKSSRPNFIEISVPKSVVPALIGRSGSNIKEIEKKSGAQIHFKKFSDKDHDVCVIRGRAEAIQLAEMQVQDFIRTMPEIEEITINVPSWSCGRIIGAGGETISSISHQSGARVKVEGNRYSDNAGLREVSIKGTKEQIRKAKELLEKCVAQEKCRREIEQAKRTPRVNQPTSPTPSYQSTYTSDASDPIDHPTVPTNHHTDPTNQLNKMPGDDKHATKKSGIDGSSIEVYVSAVSSPSTFWVQFVGQQVAQLDELVEQMTQYYGRKENRDTHQIRELSVGQVVAAVFRNDGRWYRGRVVDIVPNEYDPTQLVADVFFVDYGDSEYVATHELCELRADLLRLRFQAMECFLAGVRPAGPDASAVTATGLVWDKWDQPSVDRFEELTQVAKWKPLLSKTVTYKKTPTHEWESDREIPGIKLYDNIDGVEIDIAATLISEGLASPASPRLASRSATPTAPTAPTAPAAPAAPTAPTAPAAPAAPTAPADPAATPSAQTFGDLKKSSILSTFTDMDLPQPDKGGLKPSDRKRCPESLVDGMYISDPALFHKSRSFAACMAKIDHPVSTSEPNLDSPAESPETTSDDANPDAMVPITSIPTKVREEFKANMNRVDSHHTSLEALQK